ncbi:Na+/H+ antiporter NhaA [Geobacter sulfurreducens]|uniref:Na(+)/H(+) antiporter NhaA n=1 Tax=Geobacter sulfurreducens (strain ATCC 51573 / DSM 12127 / PCA) TaxID=243231 RepID=NHAA_GEOSL|nr:Na+/H+ antiporter NhaA [Geobacter sulfurreducens]Q74AP9.1 RecName: Full=Na(+)/H(+) antiporter NhaA; AltName: Full=Sodium/proton antiporter NhaA [Geobacter sulfurreducens PCA]AAR35679.1 sodium/proton antiporter family protein [Geobacter sulfurreducens PCA]ADI85061.1 sodium/proton antiporter family protein [Geobacter sulfurreducens KN400]QVW34152.1 Na+/H+ antiporter NhaA [Geobacter sulfurreducens]UAC03012.1 Na+/H+ antiporter NhaA [Geobacter sulfurreducens]UTG91660.1 Na+/H+ antiporter NhaA [G
MRKRINLLREFSVPLIAGVVVALLWANLDPAGYHSFIEQPFFGGMSFHFVVNELFMVLFFGIAAVEITQSCLPGGDLNPLRKAVNPLLATLGGVVGPVLVYLGLNAIIGGPELTRGWGIPTATDIALAWLVARLVFGAGHPAVSFLLLLAVADDAIGLAIIAVFYPDPNHPTEPIWLFLTVAGMVVAYILRSLKSRSYWPYVVVGGGLAWTGLFKAHLHPALALVFIIPFLPHPSRETAHLFEADPRDTSTLARFEHDWKIVVDFGLFMFGLANAGVGFSSVGAATWLVLASLVIGKTLGIFAMGYVGRALGFPLPQQVGAKELAMTGLVAGIGLTVALFVAGVAFVEPDIQGSAKMGALLSGGVSIVAIMLGRALNVRRIP